METAEARRLEFCAKGNRTIHIEMKFGNGVRRGGEVAAFILL